MKRIYILFIFFLILFSCKKVEEPLIPKVDFDEILTTSVSAVIKGLYEHNMTPNNIVIIYAETSDMISSISKEMNVGGNNFDITLTELKTNTRYYFKLRFSSDLNYYETEQYTFVTKDDDGGEVPNNPVDTVTIEVNGVSFVMVEVVGGTFSMGNSGVGSNMDETPIHDVTLSTYYVGETEVTQKLWKAVMGNNPSDNVGDNKPVDNVSWDMTQEFIELLNYHTGKKFRLPTEAEWEYAARGGKHSESYIYSGSNSVGNVAWYMDNSGEMSHDVKTKIPNGLGIYDMSGNVSEWCSDWYGSYSYNPQTNPEGPENGNRKVVRGGCFTHDDSYCRVSDRNDASPSWCDSGCGFRLVMEK